VDEWDDERMRGEGPWASTGERARAQEELLKRRKEMAQSDLHPWMCAWCGTRPTLRKELLCESCAEYLYFYIWNTFSKRSRWMQPEDWEE
jgi:hypothetical protein